MHEDEMQHKSHHVMSRLCFSDYLAVAVGSLLLRFTTAFKNVSSFSTLLHLLSSQFLQVQQIRFVTLGLLRHA